MIKRILEHVYRSTLNGRRLEQVYLGHEEWIAFKQEIPVHELILSCNDRMKLGEDVIEYNGTKVIRVAMRSHFGPTFSE